jgi:nitroimidazol reductase NimA-like FMN-containing flavoprotein (pyridoxamine 5'-phosphate oxidase superfamily)
MVNISFTPPSSPFPTILPMIGALGSFTRPSADITQVQDLYLHGYVSSRIMNLSRTPSQPDGLPVCVSTTHVDGLVLSLTPFTHNYNYRSATVFGHATLVTDPDEKMYALRIITDSVVPGRWEGSRTPPTAGEMGATGVLKVKIAAGSAKVRMGGPNDDKADLADGPLRERVWAGVVPVYQVYGEPIPAAYNKAEAVPGYIAEFVADVSKENREQAVEAAKKIIPKKVVDDEA